jgi:phosphatidate phosphatase APP1
MSSIHVKVYHGYGHTHNLVLYGHVFKHKAFVQKHYTTNFFVNIAHLLRLFFVKPVPGAKVRLYWQDQQWETLTEDDGFYKFEWESKQEMDAGWHPVKVDYIDQYGQTGATGEGKVYVPHSTQYVFISDIDDTVMVSYSATKFRRLKELLIRNPRTRQQFEKVADWYQQLTHAHTTADTPNPFFYVSSSEWNLYDYLIEFFSYNKLPEGIFLLNQGKKWYQLFNTGKTKHAGKLLRIARILDVFPKQQFVLIGDNTQHDPDIYTSIAIKYPQKIFAIYIRNVRPEKEAATRQTLLAVVPSGVHVFLFKSSDEAREHARSIGLTNG